MNTSTSLLTAEQRMDPVRVPLSNALPYTSCKTMLVVNCNTSPACLARNHQEGCGGSHTQIIATTAHIVFSVLTNRCFVAAPNGGRSSSVFPVSTELFPTNGCCLSPVYTAVTWQRVNISPYANKNKKIWFSEHSKQKSSASNTAAARLECIMA
jgi:hypothetical protein